MPSMLLESPDLSLQIAYDHRVLAPRPWTLAQAEWAADLWRRSAGGPVLELCSGVGQIGLALAAQVPADVVMVDSSPVACTFAAANAASAGLADRVRVRCGSIDAAVTPDELFRVILADPPWVPSDGVEGFPEDPVHAIDGGPDGLELARACLRTIDAHLAGDGHALLQVGPRQVGAVRRHLVHDRSLRLLATSARVYGERGALVELSRPPGPGTSPGAR